VRRPSCITRGAESVIELTAPRVAESAIAALDVETACPYAMWRCAVWVGWEGGAVVRR
jgi:hypothetical protein